MNEINDPCVVTHNGFYIGTKGELQERVSINATPDDGYVIRILQAYLEAEETTWCTDNTAGKPPTNPLCIAMNEASAKRAELLRAAIAKLTGKNRLSLVGIIGVKRGYLNLSKEEVKRRYKALDGDDVQDDDIEDIHFNDELSVYDAGEP